MREAFVDMCIVALTLVMVIVIFVVSSQIETLRENQRSLVRVIKLQSAVIEEIAKGVTKK